MKISNRQQDKIYQFLDHAMNEFSYTASLDDLKNHRISNDGKDKEKRFRWDVFYMAMKHNRKDMTALIDEIYENGGNDTHIDTVLRQWLSKRPQLAISNEVQS